MERITANFSYNLIEAARAYAGKEAIHHYKFAGNCIEQPGTACLEDGLGPERFDCSGLIIRALLDITNTDYNNNLRHVRDMWASAEQNTSFRTAELAVGVFVIFKRYYTLNNQSVAIPGHIGVVTSADKTIEMIHASARSGKVEERALKHHRSIMGFIALST